VYSLHKDRLYEKEMKVIGYPLTNMGTNCYLAYEEKTGDAVLFDPAGFSEAIAGEIKDNELNLHYIVLTHAHGDHIGGVSAFMREFPDAKLVIGELDQSMLKSSEMNFSALITGNPVELDPDLTVKDGDTLIAGALELRIIDTPGHTKGGISILIGESLFSGDTLFRESIGRTDLQGGDYGTLIDSIQNKLFILPDDINVYPGHMGTTTIGHEKGNNPFLRPRY